MLEREVELYRRLQPYLGSITFVTYGDASELDYADQLPGIHILCNRWGLPLPIYARLLPVLYARYFQKVSIFKTNQVMGAEVALRTAVRYQKPFIARCGYLWSEFAARQHGQNSRQAKQAHRVEARVFQAADQVVVTTEAIKQKIICDYNLSPNCVTVIPNYIRVDLFSPQLKVRDTNTICFVGRLEEQKNPLGLLQAVAGLDVRLVIIGNGTLRSKVEALAKELNLDITLIPRVPHLELPKYLNKASLFILPSFYEGHPKTLLEAMACGLPVIGTNVSGIRELVRHRETGYLCGTSPSEIRAAVEEVLSDKALQRKLGRNARKFVIENFSLERILEMELLVLKKLAGGEG